MVKKRHNGRLHNELRTATFTPNIFPNAAGSVLIALGNTKVLCAVTLQHQVPPFLRGKGTGWLNAEYAMLPAATGHRTQRELTSAKRNGRSVEISRLIGRSLRAVINFDTLGERTIVVDCDVLQADGGTRVTAITGAYYALCMAQAKWLAQKTIVQPILTDSVAAVSAGVHQGTVLLDPDYQEDSSIDADFNFVLTGSGDIIEMQGCAEQQTVSWEQFDAMRVLAQQGVTQLLDAVDKHITAIGDNTTSVGDNFAVQPASGFANVRLRGKGSAQQKTDKVADVRKSRNKSKSKTKKAPMFSLQNRLGR